MRVPCRMKRRHQKPLIFILRIIGIVGGFCTGLSFVLVHLLEIETNDDLAHHLVSTKSDAPSSGWPHPFIHILNTRFQQEQGNLTALGRARLVLFETFCLNSILGQTALHEKDATPFLWIIKVDPELSHDLLGDLIALVDPYDFIYVVASNVNFGVGQREGGWRGGEAGSDVLSSKIYTGNRTLLRQAHLARETRAVLETRVDADDGLNLEYLEVLQSEAARKLRWASNQTNPHRQRWMYWCLLNHIDWTPTPAEQAVNPHNEFGVFVPKKSPHVCITAGITIGVSIGVEEDQVPRYGHYKLVRELRYGKNKADCGGVSETKCLRLVATPLLGAIRSRTPTSAGMKGIIAAGDNFAKSLEVSISNNATILNVHLWREFHCRLDQVIRANRHLQDHVVDIAADNLRGQCTRGHSCKESTKEALQNLLDIHTNHSSLGKLQDTV